MRTASRSNGSVVAGGGSRRGVVRVWTTVSLGLLAGAALVSASVLGEGSNTADRLRGDATPVELAPAAASAGAAEVESGPSDEEVAALRAKAEVLDALLAAGNVAGAGAVPGAGKPGWAPKEWEQSEEDEGDHGGEGDSGLPSIESVLNGFEVVNSNIDKREATFMGLHRKKDSLIAVLPAEMLDTPWLLSATFKSGPVLTGFQIGSSLVEWRRRGNELHLVQPEIRYVASDGGANAQNVRNTFTDRFLFSVPIVAEDDERLAIGLSDMLANHGAVLVGELGAINPGTARIASAKAFAKNVEVSISAAAAGFGLDSPALGGGETMSGGGGSNLVTLHYSLSALPEKSDFEMRPADERVGFWVHAQRDYGKREAFGEKYVRTIERWNLKKADPSLRISPPAKPIVFYIEKSVPLQYRRYVRQGIEAWNEAFEAIGIVNAIEVRQQTETEYAEIDPEDVRYNFVRWITTDGGFAIALHRTDPRSGEILDADVLIDDSWIDIWIEEYPALLRGVWEQKQDARRAMGAGMAGAVAHLEERARGVGLIPLEEKAALGGDSLTMRERRTLAERRLLGGDRGALGRTARSVQRCEFAATLPHHMAKAALAWEVSLLESGAADGREARATGVEENELTAEAAREQIKALREAGVSEDAIPSHLREAAEVDAVVEADEDKADKGDKDAEAGEEPAEQPVDEHGEPLLNGVPERLIGENLVALTAHEIGHVLGLRHNFEGSSWQGLDAVDAYTDASMEPPVSSVMDYVGTFIADKGKPQPVYNTVRVGAYDRWAIECGYREVENEEELEAILAKSVLPQHRYGTDEDVGSPDPAVVPYDLGNDPVKWQQRQLRLVDRLRATLLDRLVEDGEPWSRVRAAFMRTWFEEINAVLGPVPYIGGTRLNRDRRADDAPAPLENVPAEVQRGVLDAVIARALSKDSFRFDPALLNHLHQEKWYMSNFPSFDGAGEGETSVLDSVGMVQFVLLADLFYTCTPRLLNQELRSDPKSDGLTAIELHRRLTDAVWSEFAQPPSGRETRYTNMNPMISAQRRNLQREHAQQLIDMAYRVKPGSAAGRQPQLIAVSELRRIADILGSWSRGDGGQPIAGLDDYSRVHIDELSRLIRATLDAQVVRQP